MFSFVLNLITFLSLAILVFLLSKGLERINVVKEQKQDVFEKIFQKLHLSAIDVFLNRILEKFLRLLRIIVLKTDNMTHRYLSKLIAQKKETLDADKSKTENPRNIDQSS